MKTSPLLLAPIALASSLAGAASPQPGIAMAGLGETLRIQGMRITPLRVVEDSRCPQNARCVWAGRVRLSVRIGGEVRELTLGQPVPLAGGKLNLAAVTPEKKTTRDGSIPPRAYRFGFQYSREQAFELIRN